MSNNNTLVLDFEKNIVEIEAKIESLKLLAKDQDVDIAQEVNRLEQKLEKHKISIAAHENDAILHT